MAIYRKRKPPMRVIQVTGENERKRGEPWCIAYVYSRCGNYMVTGVSNEVHDHIARNYPRCFIRHTIWKDGRERNGFWMAPFESILNVHGGKKRHPKTRRKMWKFSFGKFTDRVKEDLWFRRMPNRWLDIFDETIDYVDSMNGRM